MNRYDYDRKIIAVFDTVGSFFVDVFYNDLFLKARDRNREGSSSSVTDAYRQNVTSYMSGIKNRSDLYMTVVKKLHEYYQQKSGFGSIVFADFENKIVSQFIPGEYFKDFTNKNKDKTLNEIVVETVLELGVFILKPENLSRIIDNHLDAANVSLLQDQVVDIFILQRENYYSKFAEKIGEMGNNNVNKAVVVKLKKAFSDETQKRVKAETDRDRAVNMLSGCLQKLKDSEETIDRLNYDVATLKKQISDLTSVSSVSSSVSTLSTLKQRQRDLEDNDVAVEFENARAHKQDEDMSMEISKSAKSSSRGRRRGGKEPATSKKAASQASSQAASTKKSYSKTPFPKRKEVEESSDDSNEESDEIDDEEFHRKQQEALKSRQKSKQDNILNFEDDDPGFGE